MNGKRSIDVIVVGTFHPRTLVASIDTLHYFLFANFLLFLFILSKYNYQHGDMFVKISFCCCCFRCCSFSRRLKDVIKVHVYGHLEHFPVKSLAKNIKVIAIKVIDLLNMLLFCNVCNLSHNHDLQLVTSHTHHYPKDDYLLW